MLYFFLTIDLPQRVPFFSTSFPHRFTSQEKWLSFVRPLGMTLFSFTGQLAFQKLLVSEFGTVGAFGWFLSMAER